MKTETFIDSDTIENKIKNIINYLIINNNKIPNGLYTYIPKNTEVLDIKINNNILSINLTKDFLDYDNDKEKIIISGLVNTLLEIKDIEGIDLYVENKKIKGYEKILDKSIGINNI